ncbi:superinfection immunity protein [Flavobacterium circumlabens]|uniref:Oligomerization/nucleic acid binding protein n=1 Tax=Flavobacterium circumlabens TaxID=2133765 RepID=A0A4Y7UCL5_9FLAO|nr:superinfection immunity protein [Flavobacterium circumlabens]TCN57427.1 putative oligomerization/nucleic acid binding protein [Flavobacterium circumlabens]TEB43748.1 superinfection immunity protein [Flavobacterium circumlabens]
MGRIGAPELLIIAIPFLALYFLPSFIALSRKKTNRTAIILLNFFLGWTFIGWIASLVWACTTNNEPQTIVVNNNPYSKEESPSHLQKNDFDEKLNSLQKLKDLLDSGVLSQEEFEQQKLKVLAS